MLYAVYIGWSRLKNIINFLWDSCWTTLDWDGACLSLATHWQPIGFPADHSQLSKCIINLVQVFQSTADVMFLITCVFPSAHYRIVIINYICTSDQAQDMLMQVVHFFLQCAEMPILCGRAMMTDGSITYWLVRNQFACGVAAKVWGVHTLQLCNTIDDAERLFEYVGRKLRKINIHLAQQLPNNAQCKLQLLGKMLSGACPRLWS